jgi:heparan sulfate N-deacetylase/N-sulfotransferase NDST2
MIYHNDSIAVKYKLIDILKLNVAEEASEKVITKMKSLRRRCLQPGLYYKHIKQWLEHFSLNQIYLVDGELLVTEPYTVLNRLQKFLSLENIVDYKRILKYDKKKGFFCLNFENKNKCLGASKGRNYSALDDETRDYLMKFYRKPNHLFSKLLNKMNLKIPTWLNSNF